MKDIGFYGILLTLVACKGLLIALMASRKNRNVVGWGLLGSLVSFTGSLIGLAFMKFLCRGCHSPLDREERELPQCRYCNYEFSKGTRGKSANIIVGIVGSVVLMGFFYYLHLGSLDHLMQTPEATSKGKENKKTPLYFSQARIRAHIHSGNSLGAFRECSRFHRDVKREFEKGGKVDLEAESTQDLLATIRSVTLEEHQYPDPVYWDFDHLEKLWKAIAEHEKSDPKMKTLAEARIARIDRERTAARAMFKLTRATDTFASMRAREELLKHSENSIIARVSEKKLQTVKDKFEVDLRYRVDDLLRSNDKERWSRIMNHLKEGGELLGGLPQTFEEQKKKAKAGMIDAQIMELAESAYGNYDYDQAIAHFSKIPANSTYNAVALKRMKDSKLQKDLTDAYNLYISGQGAEAHRRMLHLQKEWPSNLEFKNVLTEYLRGIPAVLKAMDQAKSFYNKRDYPSAIMTYRQLLQIRSRSLDDNPYFVTGEYRQRIENGLSDCNRRISQQIENLVREYSSAVQKEEWIEALHLYKQIGRNDESRKHIDWARKRIIPEAAKICQSIERHCWQRSFTDGDRAAAELLERILQPDHIVLNKLDKLKKSYNKQFQGR